jgi:hypothetical protein
VLDPSETKASEYHSHAKKHKKLAHVEAKKFKHSRLFKSNLSCLLHFKLENFLTCKNVENLPPTIAT